MPHKAERRTATTKVVRETGAEAITFAISKAVGLEAGTGSERESETPRPAAVT
jgi:hypothetical protein